MSEQDEQAAPPPEQEETVAPKAPPDPSTRAAELQAELEQIRAAAAVETVSLQIHPDDPRLTFTVGGVKVGTEPTAVPAHMAGPVLDAAAEAGVHVILVEA